MSHQAPLYKQMHDADKHAFASAWFIQKDSQFATQERRITKTHTSKTMDAGRWCNGPMLVSHFGGGDPYSIEGAIEADAYIEWCKVIGTSFAGWN